MRDYTLKAIAPVARDDGRYYVPIIAVLPPESKVGVLAGGKAVLMTDFPLMRVSTDAFPGETQGEKLEGAMKFALRIVEKWNGWRQDDENDDGPWMYPDFESEEVRQWSRFIHPELRLGWRIMSPESRRGMYEDAIMRAKAMKQPA
jgi:hypothetical protein